MVWTAALPTVWSRNQNIVVTLKINRRSNQDLAKTSRGGYWAYHSRCVGGGRVQADRGSCGADGQPRPDSGCGEGAGGGRRWSRGGGRRRCERLLAAEQCLTQSREAFLRRDTKLFKDADGGSATSAETATAHGVIAKQTRN